MMLMMTSALVLAQTTDTDTLVTKEGESVKEVEIVAQKPLVKMKVDKITYNVAEDEDSKSNTVLDMLRKVPMVTVDGEDNISVNGSSSFKVLVDGLPNILFSQNPSMVFKSMPASAVKSIEVITNPGAKYDAEGGAGILNIVMNKQPLMGAQTLNGYNGSVRASLGNRQTNGSIFLSGQQGKLSYSANVMTSYNKPGTTSTEMEQMQDSPATESSQGGSGFSQLMTSTNEVKTPFTMGSLTLGYQLNELSAINATASINRMTMKSTGTSITSYLTSEQGLSFTSFDFGSSTDIKNSRTSFSGSIDYQRFFNQMRTHSLALTYQLNYSPGTTEMTSNFGTTIPDFSPVIDLTNRYSENKDKTVSHIFQFDYMLPLGYGHTLSLGSKYQLHDATSNAKYYMMDVYDPNSSSDYEYKNSILAGYGEYASNWNKFGIKAGLRYEHTWQDVMHHAGHGYDFSTDYGSMVTNASLQYNISMGSNIGLTYNMRISRPGITYLNPYVDKSNPIALTYGNSDLDIEKTHNLSVIYNLFSQKLMVNLNLHHNFTDNGISQYSFYDDNNLMNTTFGNILKNHQTGLSAYVNYLLTVNTRLFFNGGLDYTDAKSTILGQSNHGWTTNAMIGLQQTLPWKINLSTFVMTSTKTYTLQGWSGGFNMLTTSLSKSFLKDKLNLSISAMTGLNEGGKLNIESYSRGQNFTSKTKIKVPIYGVTFTVAYTFGDMRIMAKQHVSRVQNDFIEQQSQGEMLNSIGNTDNSEK